MAQLSVLDTHPQDKRWLDHLRAHKPVDFHQSPSWWSHLHEVGISCRAVLVTRGDEVAASALVALDGDTWTCWRGPVGDPNPAVLAVLVNELRLADATVALMVDTRWEAAAQSVTSLERQGGYVTNRLDLRCDEEQFLTRMTSTARNRTRRASRLGITVRDDAEAADHFFDIYLAEMRRVGSPDEATRPIILDLCRRRGAILFTAWHEGSLAAGSVALDYDGTLEMRYVFTAETARAAAPMNLLYLEAMRWGKVHGRSWLDVSGVATGIDLTDRTSALNRFKQGFGAGHRLEFARYTMAKDIDESRELPPHQDGETRP